MTVRDVVASAVVLLGLSGLFFFAGHRTTTTELELQLPGVQILYKREVNR